MASILTNSSAMSALSTLRSIASNMESTQNAISTGLKVSKASDNAAYWSISTSMRSDNMALSAVSDALGLGAAKVDTAYSGMESAIDVVKEMMKKGRKNQHKAYDEWQEKVRKFGIGDTLGIDYPGERGYKLFTAADYTKQRSKYWGYGSILSVGIGQGEITTTPLQMANIMAIIANKGYYIKPHLVKGIGNDKHIEPKYKEKHFVDIDAKHFEPVIDGMQDAVNTNTGTATESRLRNIIMCGKTGTVQNNRGKNHSVFIGFSPRDNPKIAIAVFIENAGFGGTHSAPIASLCIEKYLKGKVERKAMETRWMNKSYLANVLSAKSASAKPNKEVKATVEKDSTIEDYQLRNLKEELFKLDQANKPKAPVFKIPMQPQAVLPKNQKIVPKKTH